MYMTAAQRALANGDWRNAEDSLLAALAEAEVSSSVEEKFLASTLDMFVELYLQQDQLERAAEYALRAVRAKEHSHAFGKTCVVKALIKLSRIYYKQNKAAAAALVANRALHLTEECLGPAHPAVGLVSSQLSEIYLKMGAHDKVIELNSRCQPHTVYNMSPI